MTDMAGMFFCCLLLSAADVSSWDVSRVTSCDRMFAGCRVLKPTGSFWFHLGDDYVNGNLALIPARVAIRLTDEVGFTLHNQIAWNKLTAAPGAAEGKLCSLWEPIFFFTKEPQGYFYDAGAAFELPRKARNIMQGVAVSAACMSGARYRRKIERSTELTDSEKSNAYAALDKMLHLV